MKESDFFNWRKNVFNRFQEPQDSTDVEKLLVSETQAMGFEYYSLLIRHPVPFTRPKCSAAIFFAPKRDKFCTARRCQKDTFWQCKNERKECLLMLLLSRITFVESRQADPIFESYITM